MSDPFSPRHIGTRPPFQHLLVATDFGPAAMAALNLALDVATKFESRVTIVHVYSVPVVDYGGGGFYWPVDDLESVSRKMLDDAVASATKRWPRVEGVLEFGETWQHVLEVAKSRGADTLFVGTHGRHGLSRLLLGSVAEKLVRLSTMPVFVVRDANEEASRASEATPDTGAKR